MHAADQATIMPRSDCEEKRDPSKDERNRQKNKIRSLTETPD